MRRKLIQIFIPTLIVAGIVLTACQKNSKEAVVNEPTAQPEIDLEKSKAITQRLVMFNNKVREIRMNPDYKSTTTVSLEEAMWNIEGSLNATYGDADHENNIPNVNKAIISFSPSDPENISEVEEVELYDLVLEQVRSVYNTSTIENPVLLAVDLQLQEIQSKNTQLDIQVTTVLGKSNTLMENPMDLTWYYGLEYGTCDGQFSGQDAATVITDYIGGSYEAPEETQNSGERVFNPEWIEMIHNPWDYPNPNDEQQDNYLDYKLFFAIANYPNVLTDEDRCLCPEELYFYADQCLAFLEIQYTYPLKREFYFVEDYNDVGIEEYDNIWHQMHKMYSNREIWTTDSPGGNSYPIDINENI